MIYGKYNLPSWIYTRMAMEMLSDKEATLRTIELRKIEDLTVTAKWSCGEKAPRLVGVDIHIGELYVGLGTEDTDWNDELARSLYDRISKASVE